MNTANNKPLHKDLSFWIVAVVLVGTASAAQLYFGIPWFSQRLAQARPAPRPTLAVQRNLTATNAVIEMPVIKKASQTP